MAKFTPDEYDSFAFDALLALLRQEYAVVWLEVEAKLGERPIMVSDDVLLHGIDTFHLTNARQALFAQGIIEQVKAPTRGGSAPAVLVLRNRYKRVTATNIAIRRKRLLQARYISWTQESKSHNYSGPRKPDHGKEEDKLD